jgi:hypothetical protein
MAWLEAEFEFKLNVIYRKMLLPLRTYHFWTCHLGAKGGIWRAFSTRVPSTRLSKYTGRSSTPV